MMRLGLFYELFMGKNTNNFSIITISTLLNN